MCKNLVDKGQLDKPLIIFNRTIQRATDLNANLPSGTTLVAASIQETVSKADVISTCLGDDAAIQETVAVALQENVEDKIFVDCSTIHPNTTNELAKVIEAHGAHFVTCPG